jgi:hypothetical protein
MRRSIAAVLMGSRPVVGSSQRRIFGRPTIARAMPTRFFMPPESSDGIFASTSAGSRFTFSSTSHTLRAVSRFGSRASSSSGIPIATLSNTLSESNSAAYWKT